MNTQLFLLKWAGEAVFAIDSLGPVEALANFGWAADVGELVGGLVAAHNKDQCFPTMT